MGIRKLDSNEKKYGGELISELNTALKETDTYQKAFLEGDIHTIECLESFISYLKSTLSAQDIYSKILDKVVSSSDKTIIDKFKYGLKNNNLIISIKDLNTFIATPLAEMANEIRIAKKIDISHRILVHLLSILKSQYNIEKENNVYDGIYLTLIKILEKLPNDFTDIYLDMYEDITEYNKYIRRFLKMYSKVIPKMVGATEYSRFNDLFKYCRSKNLYDIKEIENEIKEKYSLSATSDEKISYYNDLNAIAIKEYGKSPIDIERYNRLLIREIILKKSLEGITQIYSSLYDINFNKVDIKSEVKAEILETVGHIKKVMSIINLMLANTYQEKNKIDIVAQFTAKKITDEKSSNSSIDYSLVWRAVADEETDYPFNKDDSHQKTLS